ncbi:hypothetical protein EWM64_g2369 [Hericium alpestre]|uniref:Peptidase S53 domain-containing protein n=1 Tax=Hericium alpestre TaxID=135208 RepID=A0A4Z0A5B5_9AGAM|nr:hypothetical protein EWM64_g2369 [Hericium alpestre]
MFRSDIPANTTFEVQLTAGGQNPQAPSQASLESDLDVQQTIGIATGIPTTFISVGSEGLLDPVGFLNAVDLLLNETSPPQVLSVSYGTDELGIDNATARAVCNGFAQLGARGVSVIFASGDGGISGGHPDSSCTSSDTFRPVFPATCPYVTAVGATTSTPETAWPSSSGGFSTLFPAPQYQLASPALAAYLSSLNGTYAGRFNASGRAFPDIAAIGDWVPTVWSGQVVENKGTSASAPIFAGVLGLVNAQLRVQGKAADGVVGAVDLEWRRRGGVQ